MLPRTGTLFLLLVVLATLAPHPSIAADLTGRASVIDGDTLEIHGDRIRLEGVTHPP